MSFELLFPLTMSFSAEVWIATSQWLLDKRIGLISSAKDHALTDWGTLADSQGTSTVLCGDDLKSKLGSLPAEPILRTPDGVSFRLVKDALVVGLLCAQ